MYIRESTERQAAADRFGPDMQRAGARAFCERYGLTLEDREYFDASSGRTVAGRSALQRALAEAEEYDILLFFHSSRSFRNREDAVIWKRKFREAGLVLVFTQQERISGNANTALAEGIDEVIDEQRSIEQAGFVASGLRQKFERGLHNGTEPLGYERFRAAPGDPTNGELLVVPQEAATVRKLFELYLSGRTSDVEVAQAVNAEGCRTKRGQPFTEGSVREILTNPIYAGRVVWHPGDDDEEVRPGRHQPLAEPEVFDRVQQLRRSRAHWRGRRPVARTYPLTRRASCFDCGTPVAGDTGGKHGQRRMRHARTGVCGSWRTQSASRLEEQLASVLRERITLPAGWVEEVRRLLVSPEQAEPDEGHQGQRVRLERAMAALRKQHLWGHINDDAYRIERQQFERQLREVPVGRLEPLAFANVKRGGELLRDFGSLWDHPGVTMEAKNEFIEEAFEQVQIDELGIRAVRFAEVCLPAVAVSAVGGNGAGDEVRTRDILLGRQALYH